ncbi:hypothetical protein SAMN05519103_08707 [Rhizobiales bacterium GAS113]|nr:hypothetical protein SAMN05519103_08707 [Rhizobiales bacterium GAS113]
MSRGGQRSVRGAIWAIFIGKTSLIERSIDHEHTRPSAPRGRVVSAGHGGMEKRPREAPGLRSGQKSMSPMPVPADAAGACFFGFSATSASVVISSEATEAASCKAVRTTLAGSITPAPTRS